MGHHRSGRIAIVRVLFPLTVLLVYVPAHAQVLVALILGDKLNSDGLEA